MAGRVGYINHAGDFVISPGFAQGDRFSDGLAAVTLHQDGPIGFINEKGVMIIGAQFTEVCPFLDRLSMVRVASKMRL